MMVSDFLGHVLGFILLVLLWSFLTLGVVLVNLSKLPLMLTSQMGKILWKDYFDASVGAPSKHQDRQILELRDKIGKLEQEISNQANQHSTKVLQLQTVVSALETKFSKQVPSHATERLTMEKETQPATAKWFDSTSQRNEAKTGPSATF